VMAQMFLDQNNIIGGIKVLTGIEKLKLKPAMVCTLVSLLKQLNDIDGAIRILDDTVMNLNEKDSHFAIILRGNADFKMSCKRYSEAAIAYKKLLSLDKGNLEILLLFAIANSYCDVEKARELEKQLPELSGDFINIKAEELENLPVISPTIAVPTIRIDAVDTKEKIKPEKKPKKKKKKKKNPVPKNMNVNVPPDPDRWKPKHLRPGYRGKKVKVANTRGVQGSASVSQAQQLADAGHKGTAKLKNVLPSQAKEEKPKGPTEAQARAAEAAKAATLSGTGSKKKTGKK